MITSEPWQRSPDPSDWRAPVVEAMVQLLRLEVDDKWTEDAVAPEPSQRTSDEPVLRPAQANVSKIMADSSDRVIDRASVIMERALRQRERAGWEIDHVASCGWIHDSPCAHCNRDL